MVETSTLKAQGPTPPGLYRRQNNDRFVAPKEAAHLCGFTAKAFERLRQRGKGPPYRKIGRLVRYSVEDLRCWVESFPLHGEIQ